MSEKTPSQSGHLFEFFQIPVTLSEDGEYYVFTLKSDDELPDGVTRADFCSPAVPSVCAIPVTGEDERAAKRLKGGLR